MGQADWTITNPTSGGGYWIVEEPGFDDDGKITVVHDSGNEAWQFDRSPAATIDEFDTQFNMIRNGGHAETGLHVMMRYTGTWPNGYAVQLKKPVSSFNVNHINVHIQKNGSDLSFVNDYDLGVPTTGWIKWRFMGVNSGGSTDLTVDVDTGGGFVNVLSVNDATKLAAGSMAFRMQANFGGYYAIDGLGVFDVE
jgi:hypothetical protein